MGSHRTGLLLAALTIGATACGKTTSAPGAGSGETPTTAAPTAAATATATTETTATATTAASASAPDIPGLEALENKLREGIPKGSGDYAKALALATLHKEGELPYPDLERAIVALKLPPHKLGDAYLMIPVPKPPPPAKFDPKMMPKDWEGTWGEVAMAYWLGALDKKLYAKLHRAAHPDSCQHE
jgi:hypothetical protein